MLSSSFNIHKTKPSTPQVPVVAHNYIFWICCFFLQQCHSNPAEQKAEFIRQALWRRAGGAMADIGHLFGTQTLWRQSDFSCSNCPEDAWCLGLEICSSPEAGFSSAGFCPGTSRAPVIALSTDCSALEPFQNKSIWFNKNGAALIWDIRGFPYFISF